jgi:hypothetical protein
MTTIWRINGSDLRRIPNARLDAERDLETWIESDPAILDSDLLIIGRQVAAVDAGRIDLLGIRSDGSIEIIELKRDTTPRDLVAQVLEYGSWVVNLTTADIHRIAEAYSAQKQLKSFSERFREQFEIPLPDALNTSHGMLVVASDLDRRSRRIVEYLSEVHGVGINTAFFNVFEDGEQRYLAADWLIDQDAVTERAAIRTKAPWSGYWYVNVGDGSNRSWEDMRKYGFVAAGNGRFYSGKLAQLSAGDPIYAYQRQTGYVGFGVVLGPALLAKDFLVQGKPISELPLAQPNLMHHASDEELAEYVVPVEWKKTYPLGEAKTFPGAFANQNIVCRLRDQATLDFLAESLGRFPSGQLGPVTS